MGLRTSTSLKSLIVLLFSFGMIAQAMIFLTTDASSQIQRTTISSSSAHLANFIASIIIEESSNEEEGRESKDKCIPAYIDFGFFEHYLSPIRSANQNTSFIEYEISSSQPPLFIRFHKYII